MAKSGNTILNRLSNAREINRWSRFADAADEIGLDALRELRTQARSIQNQTERVQRVADRRLSDINGTGDPFRAPAQATWTWRPELWRSALASKGLAAVGSGAPIDDGVKIFHDCPHSEISARQVRNSGKTDLARFGLGLDVFHFDGSYLSVAVDLPREAFIKAQPNEIVRIDTLVSADCPVTTFARANVTFGPNTERLVAELTSAGAYEEAEFDILAMTPGPDQIASAWVELIFKTPPMTRIVVRDLSLSRRPRAAL